MGNAAFFGPEDGESIFLRKVEIYIPVYTAPQPKRKTPSSSPT
jgi:hypothetical protein